MSAPFSFAILCFILEIIISHFTVILAAELEEQYIKNECDIQLYCYIGLLLEIVAVIYAKQRKIRQIKPKNASEAKWHK